MLFGANLTKQPAYQNVRYRSSDSLENTDLVMDNLFWIGVYPGIDAKQIKYIISNFRSFFENRNTSKCQSY